MDVLSSSGRGITKLISFEDYMLNEFEEDCVKEEVSLSEGIRTLIRGYLEQKGIADSNAINIPYADTTPTLKSSSIDNDKGEDESIQKTLEPWIRKDSSSLSDMSMQIQQKMQGSI